MRREKEEENGREGNSREEEGEDGGGGKEKGYVHCQLYMYLKSPPKLEPKDFEKDGFRKRFSNSIKSKSSE